MIMANIRHVRFYEVPAALDHVIVLLPYRDLKDPPKWLTDKFIITDGGRHTDGKTENKLIVFQDGTYIELIAFVDDKVEYRHDHWWGARSYGIIDWAFTTAATNPNQHHEFICDYLQRIQHTNSKTNWNPEGNCGMNGSFSYAAPQRGGRTRPDGTQLEWNVTFPTHTSLNGNYVTRPVNLPFFCHDVTPRELRVKGSVAHPCGASGIGEVRILVDADCLDLYSACARAVLGYEGPMSAKSKEVGVETPAGPNCRVIFKPAASDEEKAQVREHQFAIKELMLRSDWSYPTIFSYPREE
ncbi:hypothetical protein Dda_2100 [Drechslerella dactyloides]|uniref:Glyoxalase-like domain-containing protein n=1 Tax=Drechslerella dactyloides TaxID=74499 RepID=A0AAD6J722_DREDA|nr:hypothetical protein Dda_2100 [Drechslerella dactyloides]